MNYTMNQGSIAKDGGLLADLIIIWVLPNFPKTKQFRSHLGQGSLSTLFPIRLGLMLLSDGIQMCLSSLLLFSILESALR